MGKLMMVKLLLEAAANTCLQHELRVVFDNSQESINVNQTIIILYS